MPTPQSQGIAFSTESNMNSLSVPYNNNQPANLDLLYDLFALVLLLGIEKFLNNDAQNIIYSLLRIKTFIQQHFLGD